MSRDTELDRLKSIQYQAFQRKQSAYQRQEAAWERRSTTRDNQHRAFEAKQRAYDIQDSSWKNYEQILSANSPRIDSLKSKHDSLYEDMNRAFANAAAAYDRRDHASAAAYSLKGRNCKARMQVLVAKWRPLMAQIQNAKDNHEPNKVAFQRAKADFDNAKSVFNSAKAEHELAQVEYKQAKASFDKAQADFKSRLEKVKAGNLRERNDDKSIASKAGVPAHYLDNAKVVKESDGTTNIYFGGFGKPDGPGHGHYAIKSGGKVEYTRDPRESHGSQNFTDSDDRGSTLYDRRMRSGKVPIGSSTKDNETSATDGRFYDRNREVNVHITQFYDDNTRVSWNADGKSDRDLHWTDQNLGKKNPKRHNPPKDARKK